jgi:phosphohistidine phosphatase
LKNIVFVRHAKSSWTNLAPTDFERPLDTRGFHDAPIMAKRLETIGIKPQKLITSSAIRATTTADYFASVFNLKKEETKSLYHAPPETYLDVLSTLEEEIMSVIIFGHNPGITEICHLLGQTSTDNIPTCGIMISEYSGDWEKITWQKMHLKTLLFPKDGQ